MDLPHTFLHNETSQVAWFDYVRYSRIKIGVVNHVPILIVRSHGSLFFTISALLMIVSFSMFLISQALIVKIKKEP